MTLSFLSSLYSTLLGGHSEATPRSHLERHSIVLLSFRLHPAAVDDFSGLEFLSLFCKAQPTRGGHVLQISLKTEDTLRGLHHRKAILKMGPCCKALTLPSCMCSSLAPACTLAPGLLLSFSHSQSSRNPETENLSSYLKGMNFCGRCDSVGWSVGP